MNPKFSIRVQPWGFEVIRTDESHDNVVATADSLDMALRFAAAAIGQPVDLQLVTL